MRAPATAIVYRTLFALAALGGIVTQLVVTLVNGHSVANFFSYFTIESNLLGTVVFFVGAVFVAQNRQTGAFWSWLRGGTAVYLTFVGVVYNTVLVGLPLGDLAPWINVVHHMVMPAAVVADWLIWPPAHPLPLRRALLWLLYPAAYTAYSLVRGAAVHWYPYPFFDPAVQHGYGGVAVYCAVLLLAFLALAFLARFSGDALRRRRERALQLG